MTPALSGVIPFYSGVQLLVERYRAGIPEAAEELLIRFHPYLTKWNRLLTAGRWDGRDSEVRHFLELLSSPCGTMTAPLLAHRLKCYEREDLEQEILLAFLEAALKCRSIRKQFRFLLRDRVLAALKDPLTRHYHDHTSVVDLEGREREEGLSIVDSPEINGAWIQGVTCGPGFDRMNPQERAILRYTHWLGYTNDQAAQALGLSLSTVNRTIRKAKEVLKVHYLN